MVRDMPTPTCSCLLVLFAVEVANVVHSLLWLTFGCCFSAVVVSVAAADARCCCKVPSDLVVRLARSAVKSRIFQVIYVGETVATNISGHVGR